ncbi:MAG: TlpA disulfide reductase family protein [Thermodesulfovibrionales bacterium]
MTVKLQSIFICCMLIVLIPLSFPGVLTAEQRNETAPDFQLKDLGGKMHTLSEYRGKVVILNFWASWCPECITEMPSLNLLYEKQRKNGLVVLGITSDRRLDPVVEVLKKTPVSYPVLMDSKGAVFIRKYTVIGLPMTFIIDRNGLIAEKIIGGTDFSTAGFAKKIQELMTAGRPK